MSDPIIDIDLVKDSTMQQIAKSCAAIAANTGGYNITSFKDVQAIVRAGLASHFFHIGDQIIAEKETAINATVGNTDPDTSAGITAATVNADAFIAAVGVVHGGDYEFVYNGAEWHYNDAPVQLAAYGITVTGTPAHGDAVIVHETAAKLTFDVIGIDHDAPSDTQFEHSLTLQLHDCIAELQYDAAEAFYYAENGLVAGNYYFTIDPTYDATYNTYKDTGYQFTLTQDVPAKGVLTFSWGYNAQASAAKVSSWASASATTAIESVPVSSGTTGTNLGQLTTAGDAANNINSIQRVRYGSNNYVESAMRQYINSSKAAGSVWTPQTKFDRPPSWAATTAGFLFGVDPEFVAVLGKVKKVTALNNVSDGGGSVETDEKVFLISRTEAYTGNEIAGGEGKAYAYYSNYSDLAAAGTGADTNRIKYRAGAAEYWWLRSPFVGNAYVVRSVIPSGALNSNVATYSFGVAPACVII
jgi:hypothetical protein